MPVLSSTTLNDSMSLEELYNTAMGYTVLLFICSIFTIEQASGCGYTVKAIDREQMISSPGFPVGYSTYSSCQWTIQASRSSHVFINITEFDLGSGDFLSIYDGQGRSNLMASYTDMTSLAGHKSTFVTKSNTATIYFTSNWDDENNSGFNLQFVMDCLDNAKCVSVGATAACADQDIGQTFCPKLCGSCSNIISQLLG